MPFDSAQYADDGKLHILLAASGSVATIKLPLIAQALNKHENVSVRVIVTKNANEFLRGQSSEQPVFGEAEAFGGVDEFHVDEDEWAKPWVRGDKIQHIELRRWAHVLVIAPLSANTLAKVANGICDNLLTSVVRAWDTTGLIDMRKKYVLVAPAMNTAMWRHPITKKQIKLLEDNWGEGGEASVIVLHPMEKELACGDTGDGAMMDWREIVQRVVQHLGISSNVINGSGR